MILYQEYILKGIIPQSKPVWMDPPDFRSLMANRRAGVHPPRRKLLQVAAIKYARVRTFAISATRALAYFDDAEALPMPQMLDRTPWRKMKRFLEHQSIEAGRKHLHDLWE